MVVIDDSLLYYIRRYWKNKLWVQHSERNQLPKLETLTLKEKTKLRWSVNWYVRKFLASVSTKFKKDFPKLIFHVAEVRYNEPNIDFITGLNGETNFEIKGKMESYFALEKQKVANNEFDVALLLHAHYWLDNEYHANDPKDRVCSSSTNEDAFKSNMVVQDFGQFTGVIKATHEFGHLLGADDDEGIKKGCGLGDGYIMNQKGPTIGSRNIYSWSNCSVESIKRYIQSAECLTNLPIAGFDLPPSFWLYLTDPGVLPSLEEQCDGIKIQ